MTAFTDALGNTTRLEYAGLHALVKLVEPTEQEWTFRYDELERLRRIVNPRQERYFFHYDDAGRVSEETTFHGRKLSYTYDLADNLSRVEYPDGTFRALWYDPLGNVVADNSPHGSIKFERDRLGRTKIAALTEYNGRVITAFERMLPGPPGPSISISHVAASSFQVSERTSVSKTMSPRRSKVSATQSK